MYSYNFLFIIFFNISSLSILSGIIPGNSGYPLPGSVEKDSLKENQILYNGREWRNLYLKVSEDQFLFSGEFLNGSVIMNGNEFKDLHIRYDIYNDEIITPLNQRIILQLNKEMVDSFTIVFDNVTYMFAKPSGDSLNGFDGYVNVLYKGKSALYVKYRKGIEKLADRGKYDMFYQTSEIYLRKDGIVHQIKSKNDLFRELNEYRAPIRSFIKKNKMMVSFKKPDSLIPVIRYYDSISH